MPERIRQEPHYKQVPLPQTQGHGLPEGGRSRHNNTVLPAEFYSAGF